MIFNNYNFRRSTAKQSSDQTKYS